MQEIIKMEKKWEELSTDEKQEERFQRWLSPQGIEFASAEAEKSYKARVTRIKDAVQLKKTPDRVPIFPFVGFFPAIYAGITHQEAMYDYDKLSMAFKKYVLDFEPDAHLSSFTPGPGKLFEILDYKLYKWPGHGVSPNHSYQCLEGEYVNADEYDALIQDPSDFFRSVYLPRIFGALEPFKMLPPLTGILELPFTGANLIPYGLPEVQAAYGALLEAGREALKWAGFIGAFDKEMATAGFPKFFGGFSKAPFDTLGDTLRGTRGIMLDMYRQPDKLLQVGDEVEVELLGQLRTDLCGVSVDRLPPAEHDVRAELADRAGEDVAGGERIGRRGLAVGDQDDAVGSAIERFAQHLARGR